MHVLVLYDITDDRIRHKVAVACEDYGLDRLQFSAFFGQLSRTHQEELMLRIDKLLAHQPARVHLIPVAVTEWEKRLAAVYHVG
jgi:CRISPR-associated protein Cas2